MDDAPRVYLVGELNPYGTEAEYALYPLPERSAGGRLCSLILGMNRGAYCRIFERRNLCVGKWSALAARHAAEAIRKEAVGGVVVLLGSKVSKAFQVPFEPFSVLHENSVEACRHRDLAAGEEVRAIAVLPHPSGLCRLWNEWDSIPRARRAVLDAAPHLSHYVGKVDATEG